MNCHPKEGRWNGLYFQAEDKAVKLSEPLTLRAIGFRFTQRTVAVKKIKKDSQFGIETRVLWLPIWHLLF